MARTIWFSFFYNEGNPHDIVFAGGIGPRFHHAAFAVPMQRISLRPAILREFRLRRKSRVRARPAWSGHALFGYFRDPDGHRIEVFNTHYR
jgi:catechol 2,3-dioxygenase